jgi:hypothetical protein
MTFIVDGTNGLTFPNSTVQASAGKVLQVVSVTYNTTVTSTSSTIVNTNLTASITPTFSNSKILISVAQPFNCIATASNRDEAACLFYTYRNTTQLNSVRYLVTVQNIANIKQMNAIFNYTYLDSPATTSSVAYKTMFAALDTNQSVTANNYLSTITLMEIAG